MGLCVVRAQKWNWLWAGTGDTVLKLGGDGNRVASGLPLTYISPRGHLTLSPTSAVECGQDLLFVRLPTLQVDPLEDKVQQLFKEVRNAPQRSALALAYTARLFVYWLAVMTSRGRVIARGASVPLSQGAAHLALTTWRTDSALSLP